MPLKLLSNTLDLVYLPSFSRVQQWCGPFEDSHDAAVQALRSCWYEDEHRLVKREVGQTANCCWAHDFLEWFLPKLQLTLSNDERRQHVGVHDPQGGMEPKPGWEVVFSDLVEPKDMCLVMHKQLAQAQGFSMCGKYVTIKLGTDNNGKLVYEYVHRIMLWAREGMPSMHPSREEPQPKKKVAMHTGPQAQGRRLCKKGVHCVHPNHVQWGTYSANAQAYQASKKRARTGTTP